MVGAGKKRLEYLSIQYLRGVAALMVVIYHLNAPLQEMGYSYASRPGLSGGVDLFFVISGFVMWMTTRARPVSPIAFWRKRITRIVPLYWIVTTFMLAVLLLAPSVMRTTRFELWHVVSSYLFIASENPGKPAMEPLVFAGWTLNYEMFFYLIFGPALLINPKWRLLAVSTFFVSLAAVGILFSFPQTSVSYFYTSAIMLEFIGGILLGEWVNRVGSSRLMPPLLALALVVIGFGLMVPVLTAERALRFIYIGLPAIAVVAGAIALDGAGRVRDFRIPKLLGDASYSLYLSQLPIMSGFYFAWKHLHFPNTLLFGILFSFLDVIAAIVGAIIVYLLIELPLSRMLSGKRAISIPSDADPNHE